MKLHIVCPYESIAMQRMSAPFTIKDGFPKVAKVSQSPKPDPKADINYYLPYHMITHTDLDHGSGKKVIAYTHCNPTDTKALEHACKLADAVVAMSFTGRNELLSISCLEKP